MREQRRFRVVDDCEKADTEMNEIDVRDLLDTSDEDLKNVMALDIGQTYHGSDEDGVNLHVTRLS